jgi:tRNA (guanine26-N2/guanine27-N2)-dimethyltransferase
LSSFNSRKIVEGKTTLIVPENASPVKYPSFFNPRGRFVRDVSIICYQAFAETLKKGGGSGTNLTFADPLGGTGARGIRVATELSQFYDRIFLNDVSPTSIELAKQSAKENKVEENCYFSQEEACEFLQSRKQLKGNRFDVIDIDPFGTPSPWVDCGIRATKDGGLLSISATDTAVLCGVYPKVAERKYLGLPLRTDYAHETGVRLIFGLLSLTAMRFESGIMPLFCHHDMHYFRAYALVQVGNNFSRQNEKEIGYTIHCFKCGFRRTIPRDEFASNMVSNLKCPDCSGTVRVGGPLWVGKIQSKDFVAKCAEMSDFSLFEPELDLPLYYDLTDLSDKMNTRTPKILDVITELQSGGHLAGRTRLNRNAVRTDAPLQELRAVSGRLSR